MKNKWLPTSNFDLCQRLAVARRLHLRPRLLGCALVLAWMALSTGTGEAASTLIWDASGNGSALDGSGNWTGGSTWWAGNADIAWTNGAAVIFGTNTPGIYNVTNASAVTVATLTLKTNNYTIYGPGTVTHTNGIAINAGVTGTIVCPLTTTTGAGITVNAGSTLTLGGGWVSTTSNPNHNGSSLATSTLNYTNGTFSAAGTWTCNNLTINHSGGTFAFAAFNMGRSAAAVYNLSGGSMRNTTVNAFVISRGFASTLNVSGTGVLGTSGTLALASATPDNTLTQNEIGTLSLSNGIVNVGTGISGAPGQTSGSLSLVNVLSAGYTFLATAKAVINISGGVMTAKGIAFGSASGNYANKPVSQINLTGGYLYLDSSGIAITPGVTGFATPGINLSGGTLAATAGWTCALPINLTNINGNLTVQTADTNASPFNITLSGGLSGQGGFTQTGTGILTIGGAGATNNYTGPTTVNSGTLVLNPAAQTSIGSVSFTNSGTTLSTALSAAGQSWTNTSLVITNGNTVDFNFGGFQLSPSVSVIRVNGDLTLDVSDSFTIEGAALLNGTYPLMTCTGTLTVTGGAGLPAITSLPGGVAAHLAQSGKVINLVVTTSPNSPLNWGPLAAGPWNFTTTDWINAGNGNPTNYTDGQAVTFNDNATSAVVITLNTNVQPVSVTANNNAGGTTSYTIVGKGSISGGTSVLLQGTGLLALGTTNTYSGGTTVNSGTLGINYGGDGSGPSGIGTGTLTLNPGATIDNTSGSNVVLNTPLMQNWNGNITYAGSQTNLDLETGPVLLGSSLAVTVQSNVLTCGATITDNGLAYQLTIQGPGALTLSGFNNYGGGTILNSGKLNINNGGDGGADSAIGFGTFTINGGTIDNTSGSSLVMQLGFSEVWNASFAFAGSSNLDLGPGTITVSALTLTLQNGATLRTEGGMIAAGSGGLATLTLAGNGTFQTSGTVNNTATATTGLSVAVNSGAVFEMDKSSSTVHSALNLNVNTNGTAIVTGAGTRQVGTASTGLLTLGGGTFDLNGSSQTIPQMTFNSGTLQNSLSNSAASLTISTSNRLNGANCQFDVATNSSLTMPSIVWGTGSLIKTGPGTLNLTGTNTYTGSTTVEDGILVLNTATLANHGYGVASGKLDVALDPTGGSLQMSMTSLAFATNTGVIFDLASGAFGDTTSSLVAAGVLSMDGNVTVDVTNAPGDTADDVLLSYSSRTGAGLFVAGNIPPGAYIYDNTAAHRVILTYTLPPPPSPIFTGIGNIQVGGVTTGITFSGANGLPGDTYHILSSTNVTLQPLSAWTVVTNGSFNASGTFNTVIAVNPAIPRTFYVLSVP